jgi:D-glycero-D-manno-heptose 1,7-bisphosphate phosphatase
MRKALFLDRDGVINTDFGYVHTVQNFEFIDGIFDLTRQAEKNGYILIVITNQAGIGRGLYTLEAFNVLNDWMCKKFLDKEIVISKVYHSPYHPIAGLGMYKKDHISRKPNPGMINEAALEFGLNLSASILVGDKKTDMEAGVKAGVGENLLFVPNKAPTDPHTFDYNIISSHKEAASYLKRNEV